MEQLADGRNRKKCSDLLVIPVKTREEEYFLIYTFLLWKRPFPLFSYKIWFFRRNEKDPHGLSPKSLHILLSDITPLNDITQLPINTFFSFHHRQERNKEGTILHQLRVECSH